MSVLLALLVAGRLSDQAPWNEYEPSTLAAIIEEHRGFLGEGKEGDYVLDPGTDRYRVTVRDLGARRTNPASRRAFLGVWAKSTHRSPRVEELFEQDVLVEEGSREYWVLVQKVLVPALEKEFEPGDQVELFVVFIGGRVPDWIFLVNEFDATPAPRSPRPLKRRRRLETLISVGAAAPSLRSTRTCPRRARICPSPSPRHWHHHERRRCEAPSP